MRGCKGCIVRRMETVAGSNVEDKSWDGLIWSKLLVNNKFDKYILKKEGEKINLFLSVFFCATSRFIGQFILRYFMHTEEII